MLMTIIREDNLFKMLYDKYIKYHNIGAVFYPEKKNPIQLKITSLVSMGYEMPVSYTKNQQPQP